MHPGAQAGYLLFLDEPTARRGSGLPPPVLANSLRAQPQGPLTILVSTPYMDEAERASRVALFAAGTIMAVDTPANLKKTLLGDLLEVRASPKGIASRLLATHPDVISTEIFGNLVHVLVGSAARSPKARFCARC